VWGEIMKKSYLINLEVCVNKDYQPLLFNVCEDCAGLNEQCELYYPIKNFYLRKVEVKKDANNF
jgi:hypothetical protein